MIDLSSSENLFRNPWVWTINTLGQLVEAIIFFYFIHKVFISKTHRGEKKDGWILGAIGFTFILAAVDWITQNNVVFYIITMIGIPFLYTLFFYRGKFYEKLIVCITFFSIMISLEHMGIMAADLIAKNPTDIQWLCLFFLRRICIKLLMIPIANFLANHAVKLEGKISLFYWILLGGVCLVEDFAAQKTMAIFSQSDRMSFSDILLPISWVMIPVVFYSFISLLVKKNEMQKTGMVQTTYLKIQQQYFNQMMEIYESLRRFQHDYKAYLSSVEMLMEAGEYEEAHQYLKKMEKQSPNDMEIVAYTEDGILNLILNQKKRAAQKCGIDFQIEASVPQKGMVEIYDLNMLIMNLCDNAIEAAAKVEDGFVKIKIAKRKAYLHIEIENSTEFNVMAENPNLMTSKTQKEIHGLGIRIIKSIVEKYDGVYKTDSTDSVFTTTILLMDEEGEQRQTKIKIVPEKIKIKKSE